MSVQDPATQQPDGFWQGSTPITFKLLQALEAVRDIARILTSMEAIPGSIDDRRFTKILATPLYNLACAVACIFNDVEGNAKSYSNLTGPELTAVKDRRKRFFESVSISKGSALREVRNRISSHIDSDTVIRPSQYWDKVDTSAFFLMLARCLVQLMFLLELDVYSWTRRSGQPSICSLMTVDGSITNLYMKDGQPVGIHSFTFAKSPKYEVAREIENLASLYNRVAAGVDDRGSF